jgi:hypothetical protein
MRLINSGSGTILPRETQSPRSTSRWSKLARHKKRGVWDKPTMLKLLNEVWSSMPIEEFHPDLVWVAKNYPKLKPASGTWVGWGKKNNVSHGLGS